MEPVQWQFIIIIMNNTVKYVPIIVFSYIQTVRFKSYLLSLGISDPVTRETHGTGDKYFRELARQVSTAMEQPLQVSQAAATPPTSCWGVLVKM